jgi:SAM-dependent methyltransferase
VVSINLGSFLGTVNAVNNRIKRLNPLQMLRNFVISVEARWFDWRHNVKTRADQSENLRDWNYSFPYLPIRPPTARRLVRSLPIGNYSDYTFIDIGSGKGRMLLLASEFPFRKIVGVEMRQDLHDRALENVRRFRRPRVKCSQIECRLEDATRYDFPAGKLIVYLFNPFSAEVAREVLRRLDDSVEEHPREIVLVYLYPEFGSLMKTMRNFQMVEETGLHFIARSQFDGVQDPRARYTCAQ